MPANLTACGVCGCAPGSHDAGVPEVGIVACCYGAQRNEPCKSSPFHPYEEANFVECPHCKGNASVLDYRDYIVKPCPRCGPQIPGMVKE